MQMQVNASPQPAASSPAPLTVRPGLAAFIQAVDAAVARAARDPEPDPERDRRRRVVLMFLRKIAEASRVDTIECFEKILNGCLSLGYRARPLAAFVFTVLEPRFAGRVRRRLAAAGMYPSPDDIADVVAATAETLARLIRDARRSEYTLRYALLLSMADHRAIDFMRARRRRPEFVGLPEGDGGELAVDALWGDAVAPDPEKQIAHGERNALALAVRAAVFAAVNGLPDRERAALIAVDLDGAGYPEVARHLSLSPMDVGNVVRRARLLRDRALVPHLRGLPQLGGHVGFAEMQEDKELRLHMLRWSVDLGGGVCAACARGRGHLHDPDARCPGDA